MGQLKLVCLADSYPNYGFASRHIAVGCTLPGIKPVGYVAVTIPED